MNDTSSDFIPLDIAVLTVSDTRTEATDTSGATLIELLTRDGHRLAARAIMPDNRYRLRAQVSQWIADTTIRVILVTGGTGLTDRDVTPDALRPLFDKTIDGFGELFRMLSYESVHTSTMQSRAIAGIANGTYIFCLPGSTNACKTAWETILRPQLDNRHRPCNLVEILPRIGST